MRLSLKNPAFLKWLRAADSGHRCPKALSSYLKGHPHLPDAWPVSRDLSPAMEFLSWLLLGFQTPYLGEKESIMKDTREDTEPLLCSLDVTSRGMSEVTPPKKRRCFGREPAHTHRHGELGFSSVSQATY